MFVCVCLKGGEEHVCVCECVYVYVCKRVYVSACMSVYECMNATKTAEACTIVIRLTHALLISLQNRSE